MKKIITIAIFGLVSNIGFSQVMNTDTTTAEPLNSAGNIIAGNGSKKITLGVYAQVDYNQQFGDTIRKNGKMDVHRLVMFMGYQFNKNLTFVSELELEHVKEVYVEQAFLNYSIDPRLNFRTGLMLIPMGIINEYHEPVTYLGVERPNLEGKIIPTTWREMGAGFAGRFDNLSLKYQLYAVNGFLGYDGGGKLRGSDGLRKGRQKAAESTISAPNLSTKLDYYGVPGLKVGLAGYFGDTQSSAYNNLVRSNSVAKTTADSTVVGVSMVGMDVRYNRKAFQARAVGVYSKLSNTLEYNTITGKDLGSEMVGYYVEAGYDVLTLINKKASQKMVLSARYENYDTHAKVAADGMRNLAYNRTDYTFAVGYWLAPGAVLKGDVQIFKNASGSGEVKQLNFGLGVWF